MADESKQSPQIYTLKKTLFFISGQIGDVTSYQTFTFLVFTFYYAVIGLNVNLVTIGFIIWSIWNSLNDPILGFFSDHTHSRWGRRRPWIFAAFIPLAIIMILLFTPPLALGEKWVFGYFLFIICLFELFYTMYSLNYTSLFPEIFLHPQDRFNVNNVRQIASIIGLIFAFILPTFIIPDLSDPASRPSYIITGGVSAVVLIIMSIIFFIWAPKERKEFQKDFKTTPGFFQSFKFTVQNKAFMWYIPTELASWFVFGMLPTIVPLYGKFVLGISADSILIGLLLAATFISAAICMPIWTFIGKKLGAKKSWIISQIFWIFLLLPFMFIKDIVPAFICFAALGFGLSGTLYFIDIIVSDIIDWDEVQTGVRREAGYYGINAFFCRMAVIFVFLAISSVFNSVGWAVFDPTVITPEIIFGLRALMFIFPAIALLIGIISLSRYPLDGARLAEMKIKLRALHESKRLNQ